MFLTSHYPTTTHFIHQPAFRRPMCHVQRHAGRHAHRNVEIKDNDTNIELSIDVPGIKAADLSVQVKACVLSVSGSRGDCSFTRQFRLDNTIDVENLTANLEDGVLTIMAPKKEKAGPMKINITEEPLDTILLERKKKIEVETVEDDEEEVVMVESPDDKMEDAVTVKA